MNIQKYSWILIRIYSYQYRHSQQFRHSRQSRHFQHSRHSQQSRHSRKSWWIWITWCISKKTKCRFKNCTADHRNNNRSKSGKSGRNKSQFSPWSVRLGFRLGQFSPLVSFRLSQFQPGKFFLFFPLVGFCPPAGKMYAATFCLPDFPL